MLDLIIAVNMYYDRARVPWRFLLIATAVSPLFLLIHLPFWGQIVVLLWISFLVAARAYYNLF